MKEMMVKIDKLYYNFNCVKNIVKVEGECLV